MGTIGTGDIPWWAEFSPICGVTYALNRIVVSCGTAGELPQLHHVILT